MLKILVILGLLIAVQCYTGQAAEVPEFAVTDRSGTIYTVDELSKGGDYQLLFFW